MAMMDAVIAIFDAKYTYEFWRPITAIRNGDIDDNPATERVARLATVWHARRCILSIRAPTVSSVERSQDRSRRYWVPSDIPEVTLTSPSAPGVTHKFTSMRALNDEIAGARIYAGFHYRYSTVVGSDLGKKVGAYVAQNCMQPLKVAGKVSPNASRGSAD